MLGSAKNTTARKELFSSLLVSPAKKFPVASGSPTDTNLTPESKQSFRQAPLGHFDRAGLKNLLQILFLLKFT